MLGLLRGSAIALLMALIALLTAWATLALWFRLPTPEPLRIATAAAFALLGATTLLAQLTRARLRLLALFTAALAATALWWSALQPPATGTWAPDVARQVTGRYDGDILTLDGVRNFHWRTPEDFTPAWDSRSYDLATLTTVDLFMSYWAGPSIAHMLVSFGFENGDYLAWSVEVRREQGDVYSPLGDMFKAHTLVLIAADERDVIGTRTNARGEDVQLYRIKADPANARALLERYVATANALAERPVWYNSLTANCTTVVIWMLRTLFDDIPLDWRVFVNGHFPRYAYDRGVLDTRHSLEDLRAASHVTDKARATGMTPAFSQAIREGVPDPAQ